MSASLKLSTAVKAVHCLARAYPEPLSSAEISGMTGINASQLRLILSMLAKAGIIQSMQGAGGGFILNMTPDQINLQQLYCAIETRKAFHLAVSGNHEQIPLNKKINTYFLDLFEDIQRDIESKMETISLADVIDKVETQY
ncbi:RrF2 family transcriptional regulator [Fidelibacter multiformis]|jgi:Rrf2 family protein|uniref:RrF2 family transcriptional regulator n=1 Tax=Fidelibacter multiformis TaxID=3377529 RepID=UPI0037DCEB96